MELRKVVKNGIEVTYGIEGDKVVIFDPNTGEQSIKMSLKQKVVHQRPENTTESFDDFLRCVDGCYKMEQGDPWAFAGCLALCSTIIFT